jgi:hypothetical protein
MKPKPVAAATAATTLAMAVTLQPLWLLTGGDVGASALRPSEARDQDHVEPEAIEAGIATRTERQLRPLAAPPFNNSAVFTNPATANLQPQSYVWGPPLPLLAASSTDRSNERGRIRQNSNAPLLKDRLL